MWNKNLNELEQYVGTKTLLHVSVDEIRLYEDLFISCEHIYSKVNGEDAISKVIRRQAYNIIRAVYNTLEDDIKNLYANLEDGYRPQYATFVKPEHSDYKIIEFSDYKLPIIDEIKKLINENKTFEIISKTDFQGTKVKKILEFIGLKGKNEFETKYPSFIINKDGYYDKFVEDLGEKIDLSISYNGLEDISFDNYHKR